MVRITDYQLRKANDGRDFFTLTLQSGIEIIQSQSGGSYLTARKASMPCTFDEETCKSLIGQELQGSIRKVECEPYEFTIPQTGEIILRNQRWEYLQEESTYDIVMGNKDSVSILH